jgi:hypothetical protein
MKNKQNDTKDIKQKHHVKNKPDIDRLDLTSGL